MPAYGSPPLGGLNLSDWSLPFDQDRQDRRKVSNSDPDRTDTSAKLKKHPRLFRTSRHSALGEQNFSDQKAAPKTTKVGAANVFNSLW